MACQTCAERRKWIKAKAAAAYRKLTGKAEPVEPAPEPVKPAGRRQRRAKRGP